MQKPAANQIDRGGKLGIGCLCLFALPFAGVGVLTAIMAARKAMAGQWREAGMLGLFGLVFGSVGFGLMIGSFVGSRKLKQHQVLQQQFPGEPPGAGAKTGPAVGSFPAIATQCGGRGFSPSCGTASPA